MNKTFIFLLLLAPSIANAQDPSLEQWGFNDFTNTSIALGSKPLRETIGGVINIVLGFSRNEWKHFTFCLRL